MLADDGRAGERNLADHRMGNQVFGDLGRHAVHQPDRASRDAGIDIRADQFGRRRGRLFRRFQDDRASRGETGGELAHRLVDRKVPRRERSNRTDRLLDHQLIHALGARRNHAAVRATRFLGEPVDGVGAGHDLGLGFGNCFALLHRHQRSDRIGALTQQIRRFAHHLRALERGDLLPRPEAFVSRVERAIEVGLLGVRDSANRLAGCRIDDRKRLAGSRVAPFAVDEELGVRIHGCVSAVEGKEPYSVTGNGGAGTSHRTEFCRTAAPAPGWAGRCHVLRTYASIGSGC